MEDWRIKHGEVMHNFLQYINQYTNDYVLKGGTSLMECYGLDRFSEDIDFDSTNKNAIKTLVESFCQKYEYSFRIAKDTDTVKRYMINYGNPSKPLKIEVSYRQRTINQKKVTRRNNTTVYDIDTIAYMKSNAYNARDKIRDLYDVTFICKNYQDELSDRTLDIIKDCLQYKGLEQFDYLISTQKDELIDNEKLANDFLDVFDDLGLIGETQEIDEEELDEYQYNQDDREL